MGKNNTNETGLLQIPGKNIFQHSTDEIDSGYKWIDRETIYEKVFIGNMPNTIQQWVNLQKCNLTDLNVVLKIEGTKINIKSGNDGRVLDINVYVSNDYKVACSFLKKTDYL